MIASAAGCKPMLDGVLKSRNDFLEIARQCAAALDSRPQRHRRCPDDAVAERHRIKIVVEMGASTAMAGIA